MAKLMPTVFVGHGNPLNSISRNAYTESWVALGQRLPRPSAVLAVSAHWYLPACAVTDGLSPRTIHDFSGFPRELYAVQYPAPGSPELAGRVKTLLAPFDIEGDDSWGIDHGVWSVLRHVFPKADIPVVQLSLDKRQPPEFHYELGKRLAVLREEDVLILGSGNLVHNLRAYAWGSEDCPPFDWATRFEQKVRNLLVEGDDSLLVDYESLGEDAKQSIPTPEHYLPLLYVLGARRQDEAISFPTSGIDGGAVSMLAIQWG